MNLQTVNDLQPIAKELRERQESIEAKLDKWKAITSDMVADAQEQGRAIILAKTKLGKACKWGDWLHAHVPNVSEVQAAKYERIATEQLSDPRQCVFAFLPPADKQATEAPRIKAAEWELAWGHLDKLSKYDPAKWPAEQQNMAKDQVARIVRVMGGTVSWQS